MGSRRQVGQETLQTQKAQLGQGIEEPTYGTSKKCAYDINGIGVLRIPNVANGVINESDLKFAEFDSNEFHQYKLIAGYLIRLRTPRNVLESKFVGYNFSSTLLRSQIEFKTKSTSGVNNINSNELKSLLIPICNFQEQHQIVQEIESRFLVVEKMEQAIEESLQKAEALRQSILKRAFEGKLVPQDLADEPASELLARIRAERATVPRSRGRKRKEVAA